MNGDGGVAVSGVLREEELSRAIEELADSMGPTWGDERRGSVEVRDELLRLAESIDFDHYYEAPASEVRYEGRAPRMTGAEA